MARRRRKGKKMKKGRGGKGKLAPPFGKKPKKK